MTCLIRDYEPRSDREAALSFIMGSQIYEAEVEPNRRTDAAVAADFLPLLMQEVERKRGRILVAESGGHAVGWAVMTEEDLPIFVTLSERHYCYIGELFVAEAMRGKGIGRKLMAACEDEARARGIRQIMIGVLTANKRTHDIYRRAGYGPYASELRKYL